MFNFFSCRATVTAGTNIPKSVQCVLQADECFVVLSTTTVIVLMIHNPPDWLGKTPRCGTLMVSAENQCNYVGISSKYNPFFLDEEMFFKDMLSAGFCFETGKFLYAPKNVTRSVIS